MKLADLDASFVAPEGRHGVAVQFRCPGCRRERIVIPLASPIDLGPSDPSMNARGVLWGRTGETLETLTLAPSVDFQHTISNDDPPHDPKPCHWHGWIREGQAVSC